MPVGPTMCLSNHSVLTARRAVKSGCAIQCEIREFQCVQVYENGKHQNPFFLHPVSRVILHLNKQGKTSMITS